MKNVGLIFLTTSVFWVVMASGCVCKNTSGDSKSLPQNASLDAALCGTVDNPFLCVRLRNIGDLPLMVDKELVFLPDIILIGNGNYAVSYDNTAHVDKPSAGDLKGRLIFLKRGEEIKREIYLRKGFKRFVFGMSVPSMSGDDIYPKITGCETISKIPVNENPVGIMILCRPGYAFEEGLQLYIGESDAKQFYTGPLFLELKFDLQKSEPSVVAP
jgi:hypothetical protein